MSGWLSRQFAQWGVAMGRPSAMVTLGAIHETSGQPDSFQRANALYRQAAERGSAQAMCNIGMNFLAAKDGETDHDKAIEWLQRAADLRHPMACWALGKMYLAGRIVNADRSRGMALLTTEAEQGFKQAAVSLADIFKNAKYGFPADESRAEHWAVKSRPWLQQMAIRLRVAKLRWPDVG